MHLRLIQNGRVLVLMHKGKRKVVQELGGKGGGDLTPPFQAGSQGGPTLQGRLGFEPPTSNLTLGASGFTQKPAV